MLRNHIYVSYLSCIIGEFFYFVGIPCVGLNIKGLRNPTGGRLMLSLRLRNATGERLRLRYLRLRMRNSSWGRLRLRNATGWRLRYLRLRGWEILHEEDWGWGREILYEEGWGWGWETLQDESWGWWILQDMSSVGSFRNSWYTIMVISKGVWGPTVSSSDRILESSSHRNCMCAVIKGQWQCHLPSLDHNSHHVVCNWLVINPTAPRSLRDNIFYHKFMGIL